jgi:hypothetical protein
VLLLKPDPWLAVDVSLCRLGVGAHRGPSGPAAVGHSTAVAVAKTT